MRITDQWSAYNERRYSRPWIGKITAWPIGEKPTIKFGGLVGRTTEIDAEVGDLIRGGQRDNRGGNGVNEYSIVTEADDTLARLYVTPEAAREYWLAREAGAGPAWVAQEQTRREAAEQERLDRPAREQGWREFWSGFFNSCASTSLQVAAGTPPLLTHVRRGHADPIGWYLVPEGVLRVHGSGSRYLHTGLTALQIEQLRQCPPDESGPCPFVSPSSSTK